MFFSSVFAGKKRQITWHFLCYCVQAKRLWNLLLVGEVPKHKQRCTLFQMYRVIFVPRVQLDLMSDAHLFVKVKFF